MRIAHIGSTGKVGSKIREELLRRGHTVTVISRHPEKAPADKHVTMARGDITSPDTLAPVLKGHDAVISSATFLPSSNRGSSVTLP
jgi:putative NADH-flavin reductase